MLNSNDSSGYIGYFQLAQIYKYEKDTENAEKYYKEVSILRQYIGQDEAKLAKEIY